MDANLIQEKPEALALIVCDQILVEAGTGKKTLIGIFNEIGCSKFPAAHPNMVVFVSVTGGRGTYGTSLRLIFDGQEKPIFEIPAVMHVDTPMQVVEFAFKLRGLNLSSAGLYRFEFLCNEELIFSRVFSVKSIEPSP